MKFERNYRKLKEIKEKCKAILQKEAEKYGIALNIEPTTIVEYYDSDVFKGKTKLQKTAKKLSLHNVGGFYDYSNKKIIVFLDRMAKYEKADSPNKFTACLFASYHEFKHQLQHLNKDCTKSEYFVIELEKMIKAYIPGDYKLNHDKYYMELDANLYGIKKLEEYYKQNEPEQYEQAKEYINKRWGNGTQYYLRNYDFQKTFTKFYLLCKVKKINFHSLNIPGLEIFFDENNKFRSLSEILELYKNSNLDESILYGVLGSTIFVRQLNISSLSEEEKQFMSKVLNTVLEEEKKRLDENTKIYEERKIKSKEYFKSCKGILRKIKLVGRETLDLSILFLRQRKKILPTINSKLLQRVKQKISGK